MQGQPPRISSVLPNPGKGGTETITLQNPSDTPVDMEGWVLTDASNNKLKVQGTIPARGQLSVTPKGSKLSLNNKGDTVTLTDPNGQSVSSMSYTAAQAKPGQQITNTQQRATAPTTGARPPAPPAPPPAQEQPPPQAEPVQAAPVAPIPFSAGDTPEVLALQSLNHEPTGIDPALLSTLVAFEKTKDAKERIALLQKADKNQTLRLMLQLTDPDNPLPSLPASTVHNLQNLRDTLMLVETFRTKDGYLNILPRTDWIAPPDGTVRLRYSKGLVEAIALAHAYELATTRAAADNYFNALVNVVSGPDMNDQQSAEFVRIVQSEGSGRLPRLIRAYVETFAHAQLAKAPEDQRKTHSIDAMRAAHAVISAYKFDTNNLERKHYEQAYRIAFEKILKTEIATQEAKAIAADMGAGYSRLATTNKASSDVTQMQITQNTKTKAVHQAIDNEITAQSGKSYVQKAQAIRDIALEHNRTANIPDVPHVPVNGRPQPQVATAPELKNYAKKVKDAIGVSEKQLKAGQESVWSNSAARGIGIITALDSTPHTTTRRNVLGDKDAKPGNLVDTEIGRIRKLGPNLGVKP